jgi:hypothetical protein
MSADHSLTRMIREINNSDASRKQEELVDRYMQRLAALARKTKRLLGGSTGPSRQLSADYGSFAGS